MPRLRKAAKLPDGMVYRHGAYYARFRKAGRQVRKRLSTDFKAACQMLNELKSRADKADFGILDNDYSWAELRQEFLKWAKQTRRPGVFAEYERDLDKFEAYSSVCSVRQVDHRHAIGFRDWRLAEGKVSARTINRQVGTVHNMFNKGVRWNRIASNPLAGLQPLSHETLRKERRSLTVEEVAALFDASADYLKPVWRMFMVTGIRKRELAGMKFDDIDFERRIATVRAVNSKTGKTRDIPLDDETAVMLLRLREEAESRQPVDGRTAKRTQQQHANFSRSHVFVTQANTPWRNNLLTRFYSTCRRAGIADAVPRGSVDIHSLRVSFATLSLEHGANPKAVQAILGHATLAMTMAVYAKATEKSKREAVSALPFAKASAPEHVITVQSEHQASTSKRKRSQTIGNKEVA